MHIAFGRVRHKTSPTAIGGMFGVGSPAGNTPTKTVHIFFGFTIVFARIGVTNPPTIMVRDN